MRDENLTRRAKELLEKGEGLSNFRIHVEVVDGIVHLYGKLGNRQQAVDAERLVEGIIGVIGVVNHLTVEEEKSGEKH